MGMQGSQPSSLSEEYSLHSSNSWPFVGKTGPEDICDLYKHLYGVSGEDIPEKINVRSAPSLITRGESYMLGIPSPRFAIRAYLKDPVTEEISGILNLRKLSSVIDQMNASALVKKEKCSFNIFSVFQSWRSLLYKASSFADCLIAVPKRMSSPTCKVITAPTKVFKDYGEDIDLRGLPFMKHLQIIGGGMCAQACCYMATMLRYDEAKSIPSTPDITLLAQNDFTSVDLPLQGLTPLEMVQYFCSPKIDLGASYQVLSLKPLKSLDGSLHQRLAMAIKSYILSDCPVVLAVDMDRMHGLSSSDILPAPDVYSYNNIKKEKRENASGGRVIPNPKRHAVLIVGYKSGDGQSDEVIFNDPAHHPLMKMNASDLCSVGCYDEEISLEGIKIHPGQIIPITSKDVKLPLLRSIRVAEKKGDSQKSSSEYDGLINISINLSIRNAYDKLRDHSYEASDHWFRLINLKDLCIASNDNGQSLGFESYVVAKAEELLNDGSCDGCDWLWVEKQGGVYLFWNAQMQPPDASQAYHSEKYLISVGFQDNGVPCWKDQKQVEKDCSTQDSNVTLSIQQESKNGGDETNTQDECMLSASTGLEPLLISSIHDGGMQEALQEWPRDINCDLYAFMRKDIDSILGIRSLRVGGCGIVRWWTFARYSLVNKVRAVNYDFNWRNPLRNLCLSERTHPRKPFPIRMPEYSIRDWLAKKKDDNAYIRETADRIIETMQVNGVKLESICTFFPSLCGSDRSQKKSIDAIIFITKLAKDLNKRNLDCCHISAVTVVGGSLVKDILWIKKTIFVGTTLRAHIKNTWQLTSSLLSFLTSLLGTIKVKHSFHASLYSKKDAQARLLGALESIVDETPSNIKINLELEPSSIAVLSDEKDLLDVANAIANNEKLKNRCGFNCDIAHWSIAGIQPQQLNKEAYKHLYQRIHHAHISDSGKGHFADLPLSSDNQKRLKEWIDIIGASYISQKTKGFISLELEFANKKAKWENSIKVLQNIL